jgi:hypothetical protein
MDVLKLLVVHIQRLFIICNIGVVWPPVMLRLQQVLISAVSSGGSDTSWAFAPACLVHGADAAQQAALTLAYSICSPLAVVVLVPPLWALRWLWVQRRLRQEAGDAGRGPIVSVASALPDAQTPGQTGWLQADVPPPPPTTSAVQPAVLLPMPFPLGGLSSRDSSTRARRAAGVPIAEGAEEQGGQGREWAVQTSWAERASASAPLPPPPVILAAPMPAATRRHALTPLERRLQHQGSSSLGDERATASQAHAMLDLGQLGPARWSAPVAADGSSAGSDSGADNSVRTSTLSVRVHSDNGAGQTRARLHGTLTRSRLGADPPDLPPCSQQGAAADDRPGHRRPGSNATGAHQPWWAWPKRAARRLWRSLKARRLDTSLVDQHVGLRQQLLVAVLIAVFVQYPNWATAGFRVFACRTLDSGADATYGLAHYLAATAANGYWMANPLQECYTGVHAAVYVPAAVVVLGGLSLGPPLVSFLLLLRLRPRLAEERTRKVYGFLYDEFRPEMYWWQSVAQLQTLVLVATQVFSTVLGPYQQVTLMLLALVATGAVEVLARPSKHVLISALHFCSATTLVLTLSLGLFCVNSAVLADPSQQVSDAALDVVGALMVVLNVGLLLSLVVAMVVSGRKQATGAVGGDDGSDIDDDDDGGDGDAGGRGSERWEGKHGAARAGQGKHARHARD